MEMEPGLDFMPLSCVNPVFANSYYFSQESCQRDSESVALFSEENSLCSFSRSEHKMVLPSTDFQPPCNFTLLLILGMLKMRVIRNA